MNIEELEVLRPLLESLPRSNGEVIVGGDFDKAICLSCGAMDDMIMIREHRPDCAYKAHWRAIDALQRMLPVKQREDCQPSYPIVRDDRKYCTMSCPGHDLDWGTKSPGVCIVEVD